MSIDEWVGHGIPDQVIDKATEWIAVLDADNVSVDKRREFMRWIDQDPAHRWAFEELAEIWAKTSLLKDTEHLVEQSKVLHFPSHQELVDAEHPRQDYPASYVPFITISLIFLGLLLPHIKSLM